MDRACRPSIIIKRNAELLERRFIQRMESVNDDLRRNALFIGRDGDRYAMLIRAANKEHTLSRKPLKTSVKIGRQVATCQMANMQRPVRIRQRCRDKCTFEF